MPKTHTYEYTLEVKQDDAPIRGNAMASGDDAADRQLEDELIARLDSGDVWAWCCVRVIATRGEHTGKSDWLGGCSYASEADYIACADYYTDQCAEALADLTAKALRSQHAAEEIVYKIAKLDAQDDEYWQAVDFVRAALETFAATKPG